jgi:hypothetical protein
MNGLLKAPNNTKAVGAHEEGIPQAISAGDNTVVDKSAIGGDEHTERNKHGGERLDQAI